MPIMNGYEASEQLVELMKKGKIKNIPIIANSAFSEAECWPSCKEAGMTAYCKNESSKIYSAKTVII